MQCKDIPDQPIIDFIKSHHPDWCTWWEDAKHMPTVTDAFPPNTPSRLVLAKLRSMIKRKLIDGCDCGCRGDFRLRDDAKL